VEKIGYARLYTLGLIGIVLTIDQRVTDRQTDSDRNTKHTACCAQWCYADERHKRGKHRHEQMRCIMLRNVTWGVV